MCAIKPRLAWLRNTVYKPKSIKTAAQQEIQQLITREENDLLIDCALQLELIIKGICQKRLTLSHPDENDTICADLLAHRISAGNLFLLGP